MDRFEFEKRIFLAIIQGKASAGVSVADDAAREQAARDAFEWAKAFTKIVVELDIANTPFDGFNVE